MREGALDVHDDPDTRIVSILGERVSAEICLKWGLAEQVVPDRSTMKAAMVMAEKILAKPPIPVAMTKKAVTAVATALDRASIYTDSDQFLFAALWKNGDLNLFLYAWNRLPSG